MGASQGHFCKPCNAADPTSDTVKVDSTLLSQSGPVPQKQQSPEALQAPSVEEPEVQSLAEDAQEQHRGEEEDTAQKLAEEAEVQRRREEEEKRLEEVRKMECEHEGERERAAAEAEVVRLRDEEDQERRKAEEARAVAAQAQVERDAQVEAQRKVDVFLKKRGFKSVSAPRKAFCGAAVFPMHLAIEEGDTELACAMLRCGAKPSQKNSAGKTAREVAERCNQSGSHDVVIAAMGAAR